MAKKPANTANLLERLIVWLRRCWDRSEVQTLRAELQREQNTALLLQDRLDAAIGERSKLWDMLRESIGNERASYQMHINVEWQKRGFGAPYPDAPHIPPALEPQKQDGAQHTSGRRTTPSGAVRDATANFIREYVRGPETQ
jgi:hypothetical protein